MSPRRLRLASGRRCSLARPSREAAIVLMERIACNYLEADVAVIQILNAFF